MNSVLVIATQDELIREHASRWCVAVGTEPTVVSDHIAARRLWRSGTVLMIGDDLASDIAETHPPRRSGVLLLSKGEKPWELALALGAEDIADVMASPESVMELLREASAGHRDACVLSVTGACGGAGASSLAAALALHAARRSWRTMALDTDPFGGGWGLLLGSEQAQGVDWNDISVTAGGLNGADLREALPQHSDVTYMSWAHPQRTPLRPQSAEAVLRAARRSHDLVVVDLDRSWGLENDLFMASSAATFIVVPEEIRAVAGATAVIEHIGQRSSPFVVARHRSGGIDPTVMEDLLGVPVVARIKNERNLSAAIEAGDGPGRSRTLRKAAEAMLGVVGLQENTP